MKYARTSERNVITEKAYTRASESLNDVVHIITGDIIIPAERTVLSLRSPSVI